MEGTFPVPTPVFDGKPIAFGQPAHPPMLSLYSSASRITACLGRQEWEICLDENSQTLSHKLVDGSLKRYFFKARVQSGSYPDMCK